MKNGSLERLEHQNRLGQRRWGLEKIYEMDVFLILKISTHMCDSSLISNKVYTYNFNL